MLAELEVVHWKLQKLQPMHQVHRHLNQVTVINLKLINDIGLMGVVSHCLKNYSKCLI